MKMIINNEDTYEFFHIKYLGNNPPECIEQCNLKEKFLNNSLPLNIKFMDFYKKYKFIIKIYIKELLCNHKYKMFNSGKETNVLCIKCHKHIIVL